MYLIYPHRALSGKPARADLIGFGLPRQIHPFPARAGSAFIMHRLTYCVVLPAANDSFPPEVKPVETPDDFRIMSAQLKSAQPCRNPKPFGQIFQCPTSGEHSIWYP